MLSGYHVTGDYLAVVALALVLVVVLVIDHWAARRWGERVGSDRRIVRELRRHPHHGDDEVDR